MYLLRLDSQLQDRLLAIKNEQRLSPLSQLQLFLPMHCSKQTFEEFQNFFFWSLEFLFPKNFINLLILLDVESSCLSQFSSNVTAETRSFSLAHRVQLVHNKPPSFSLPKRGHDRQQWLMFWADNFTVSKYVGFVDSDAVFTARILEEDLFVNEKPHIFGTYGEPFTEWWGNVPAVTHFSTGFFEPFMCMTSFPIIVHTHHLGAIRQHIQEHLQQATFDEAFQLIIQQLHYSQFNIFCTVLYFKFHDDYFWTIAERKLGGNTRASPISLHPPAESLFREHEGKRCWPRHSMHWSYEHTEHTSNFKRIMQKAVCHGSKDPQLYLLPFCSNEEPDKVFNIYEWLFEGYFYLNASTAACKQAHRARRMMVKGRDDNTWNESKLKYLASDILSWNEWKASQA